MQPAFRQLAPAPSGGNPEPSGSEPRKRKKARLACNHCRLKRIGCDGVRPACARCQRARVACVYLSDDIEATPTMALKSEVESLRQRLQEHNDFLENFLTAPEEDALNMIRRLRSSNASAVLSSYQGRAEPSQLSEPALALPWSFECELAMRHPIAYPVLAPPSPSSLASISLVGESTQTTPSATTSPSPTASYIYCDPRLEMLKVRYWTRIDIDDGLAARAISHFLVTDHPMLGFFDADLFVQDLVDECLNFCTSFLFHSVMSLACQSYSAEDLRTVPLSVAFMDEALKLWHAERLADSTPTLAALNCLSVAASWHGRSELGNHQLAADARAMAIRMQLLDVPPAASIDCVHNLTQEMRDQAHVAWGSYAWQSSNAIFFPKPPIKYPPNFPIPGDMFDMWNTEPTHPPQYTRYTFTAVSRFWVIVQEILAVYNMQDESPLVDRAIPAFAESKYLRLLAWADALPKEPSNDTNCASHVYLLQYIYSCDLLNMANPSSSLYHTAVLTLFRPFSAPPNIIQLRSFSSPDSTSHSVFSASVKQLKRIVYAYRTHVPRHLARSIIFSPAVLHLSSIIVHHADTDASWKYYFRLCFEYCKDAYVCYRVFAGIVPAHLSLALQAGAITAQEARLLKDEFMAVGRHHRAADEVLTDSYVDFQKAIRKADGATMYELVEKLEELMAFEDFLHGFGDIDEL
ncbi:hypothetical protein OPT61_g10119 [Boeremia exigua]|uniref:Uncharacterized protein n=1 Tax=Boeremia exigua TaxID=749465 RepID=A0ACC2HRQ6_9PLEO|nr:hypothetical protein OPT61_g10119 [Boeremia exigua]